MLFRKNTGKHSFLFGCILLFSAVARADGPPAPPSTNSPFVTIMIIIMLILGLAIALLANVLLGAAHLSVEKERPSETPEESTGPVPAPKQAGGQVILAFTALSSMVNGVSDTAFYMMTGVVFLEVAILLALLYNVRLILSIYKKKKALPEEAAVPAAQRLSWWDKFNRFKPVGQEMDLDLGHDYDGIRELDNRLPPWWLYGFYCTIIFAGVYLWRYHVAHTAPLSGEEFQIAMQQAEVQKAAYLKKAANNIDENSVKLLTGEGDLAAGKAVFETTCFACHGKAGEGGVGPNLTDEYWLHGGSIQELFKTIKYGWPEKGMKSWKDDYSPSQIAQIASYVKTLVGTHPANPKPPQGTISK